MEAAVADSLKRLIRPSIETELLAAAKEKADDEAIGVFAETCGSCSFRRRWGRSA